MYNIILNNIKIMHSMMRKTLVKITTQHWQKTKKLI